MSPEVFRLRRNSRTGKLVVRQVTRERKNRGRRHKSRNLLGLKNGCVLVVGQRVNTCLVMCLAVEGRQRQKMVCDFFGPKTPLRNLPKQLQIARQIRHFLNLSLGTIDGTHQGQEVKKQTDALVFASIGNFAFKNFLNCLQNLLITILIGVRPSVCFPIIIHQPNHSPYRP